MNAVDLIKKEEGFRARAYYCTAGLPTIGYGRVVGGKGDPLPMITTTAAAESAFVEAKAKEIQNKLIGIYPQAWNSCNEARQAVLISMVYQLGFFGFSKFRRMIAAVGEANWREASRQALDSQWAKQTPNRAKRHAEQLESGVWHEYYGVE